MEFVKNNIKNPGPLSVLGFLACLFVALGTWGEEHVAEAMIFADLLTPHYLFSFLGALGPVLVAWLLDSPRKGGGQ